MTPFIFETPRLIIRAFRPDDLHAIHRIPDLIFGDGSKIADDVAYRDRWLSVCNARLRGVSLPRSNWCAAPDSYYMRDGHHHFSVVLA